MLAAGLLGARDARGAVRLAAGAAAAFAAACLPFAGRPDALAAPYRFHAVRLLTGESLPYLPLRALGVVDRPERAWFEVAAPDWVPAATLAVTAALLAALAVAAARRPGRAVALAAAAPAVFLLGNRIFSPQFLLPLALVWAVGMAGGRAARRTGVLLAVAATANHAVWPTAAPRWEVLQVVLFAAGVTATVILVNSRHLTLTAGQQLGRTVTDVQRVP